MLLYWTAWILTRTFARLFFRLQIVGAEHIPKSGGVLIAANHASYLDIPILGCSLPRRTWYLGRLDLFSGISGALLRYMGWIPMRRDRVDRRGFDEAMQRLKDGQLVTIYPEGGRSHDGRLQPGKPGIAILLDSARCPVVPAFLHGTYDALPPGGKWIRPGPISVAFGKPMDFTAVLANASEEAKKAIYQRIGQEIMDRIAELKNSHVPPATASASN
jgi:1-acyl-sn-glycerol-3-phosphate acyltransferase